MTTTGIDSTGVSVAEWEDLDRRHVIHPHQSGASPQRTVVVRGAGSTVWDAGGAELLDVSGGGNWAAQVGHGREELVTALAEQASQLAYFSGFFGFTNDKAVRLAVRLSELAPEGLSRVFFTCGGSEGVETAIKVARLYHHSRGDTDRTWIISRQLAYHGATYGSGTATGFAPMHVGIGPNLPHVEKVSAPYPYRADDFYGGQDTTEFLLTELAETIERLGADNIAAMIGEPVMGGGGILTPPPDYWPRVRELLSAHGILLIADEVVTAFGRTGTWFDSAARGMRPDMIVTAKGLTSGYAPLGAVLIRDDIGEAVAGEGAYFFHGHTYSAHPTACAVALANLDLIEQDGLLGRAKEIGEWFAELLAPLAELPVVGDIRVEGATAGIELVADKATREPIMAGAVTTELREAHGVILRDYGPTLVLSPPLVLRRDEAERAVSAIAEVLGRLGTDGKVTGA
ncbi:putrescine aminotransferase [Actinokineospora baliensis]|uniref:aminotransferase family protein n=1 Tax=Actinokineospora baliensis TaxID=547056 RepID=UPI0027DBF07A|nr:aspartate aminotransferase family protein [Actinokineospora baliensis]MBM7774554.1 putrescine aminotransferase [Actinokineospora baliensis]